MIDKLYSMLEGDGEREESEQGGGVRNAGAWGDGRWEPGSGEASWSRLRRKPAGIWGITFHTGGGVLTSSQKSKGISVCDAGCASSQRG